MTICNLSKKIDVFKNQNTIQLWKMDNNFTFDNDYINLMRIDSSNKAGGQNVKRGKQWSIIIDKKKDFTNLQSWKSLKEYYGNDLSITEVTRGRNAGFYGIRFYKMSTDPTNEIIYDILNFIFNM